MGKAGYRKFLKKERAKVKLKGSKTVLPKGQNVTDTNFKVKKIIIKDQIKQHGAGEVLSKRKLNVKVGLYNYYYLFSIIRVVQKLYFLLGVIISTGPLQQQCQTRFPGRPEGDCNAVF
jgi:hypothetical protein